MNNKLFKVIKKLKFPRGKYALFGSTPIGIRNLRIIGDIDIIVTKDIFKNLKNDDDWTLKTSTSSKSDYLEKIINGIKIQIWKDWHPGKWDIKKLIKNSEIIKELPFVSLKNMIKWKKMKAREKDLRDVKIAEKFLKSNIKNLVI